MHSLPPSTRRKHQCHGAAGLPARESSYSRRLPKVAVYSHLSGLFSAGFVIAYGGGTASDLHRLPWTVPAFGKLIPQPTGLVKSGMDSWEPIDEVGVLALSVALRDADYDGCLL